MKKSEPKIILVFGPREDSIAVREVLKGRSFKVVKVSSIDEVNELATEASAVICDISGDQGQGWQRVLEAALALNHKLRLFVSTSKASEKLWAEVTDSGGYGILLKPFRSKDIRTCLGDGRHTKTLQAA